MTDKTLSIKIRTEVQKGFGEISKQMSDLSKELKSLGQLTAALQNNSKQLELANQFRKATQDAKALTAETKKLSDEQRAQNKAIADGVRIANQSLSAQDKYLQALGRVKSAEAAGKVSAEARLNTEIKLTKDLIKQTGDLSAVQQKRGPKGQFQSGPISTTARKSVMGEMVGQAFGGLKGFLDPKEVEEQGIKLETTINNQADRIKVAMNRLVGGAGLSRTEHNRMQNMYDQLFGTPQQVEEGGIKLVTVIDAQNERIKYAMQNIVNPGMTSFERGEMAKFYNGLAEEAEAGGNRLRAITSTQFKNSIAGPYTPVNMGKIMANKYASDPEPSNGGGGRGSVPSGFGSYGGGFSGGADPVEAIGKHKNAIEDLLHSYTKLGHLVFQLQYSTYTLFAETGLAFITHQIDEYSELQNQIARTSKSTDDLKNNMRAVLQIGVQTNSTPEAVGKIFNQINMHSDALGMSNAQVLNTTKNVQAVLSTSAINNQAKTRASTEFAELVANDGAKGGGRQLQALQRETGGLVTNVVQKYVQQRDGLSTLPAITGKDAKITGKDFLEAFDGSKNPEIDKLVNALTQNRNFTTDDIAAKAKDQFLIYLAESKAALGVFQNALNGLAHWLGDYNHFKSLMNGLESAGVGLAAFGTAMLLQSGGNALGKVGGAVSGAFSKFGATADIGAAKAFRDASILTKVAPSELGIALPGEQAVSMAAHGEMVAQRVATLDTAFNQLSPTMQKLAPLIEQSSAAAVGLGIALEVIEAAVAPVIIIFGLLVARFNYLLGSVNGGVNVFDIVGGLFHKLTGYLTDSGNAVGRLTGPLLNLIDNLLKRGVSAANNDPDIKNEQLKSKYGGDIVHNGMVYGYKMQDQKAVNVQPNAADAYAASRFGTPITPKTALEGGHISKYLVPLRKADAGAQETKYTTNKDGSLSFQTKNDIQPSGIRAGVGNGDGDAKAKKDPYGGINEAMLKAIKDSQQYTADIKNNISDAWVAIDKVTNDQIDAFQKQIDDAIRNKVITPSEVDKLKTQLGNVRAALDAKGLSESADKYAKDMNKISLALTKKNYESSLSTSGKEVDASSRDMLSTFFNNANFYDKNKFKKDDINDLLNGTKSNGLANAYQGDNAVDNIVVTGKKRQTLFDTVASPVDLIDNIMSKPGLTDQGVAELQVIRDKIIKISDNTEAMVNYRRQTSKLNEANRVSSAITGMTPGVAGFYGEQRTRAQSYASEMSNFVSTHGGNVDPDDKDLQARLKSIQDSYIQLDKYNADWKNGALDGIAEYMDGLKNVAAEMKNVFTNAFKSLEDTLTTWITTGKADFKGFADGVVKDLASMFVKTQIMPGITKGVGGIVKAVTGKDPFNQADPNKMMQIATATLNIANANIAGLGGAAGGAGSALSALFGGRNEVGSLMNDASTTQAGSIDDLIKGGQWANFDPISDSANNGGFAGNLSGPGGLTGLLRGLTGGLGGLFSKGLGGLGSLVSGAGSWLSSGLGFLANIFHTGGTVGGIASSRMVNPGVFANAVKYHTGGIAGMAPLASNEVPAILTKGERVLTTAQQKAMNTGTGTTVHFQPSVQLNYHAATNGSDPQQDAADMSGQVGKQLETQFNQLIIKHQRPGGLLYNK